MNHSAILEFQNIFFRYPTAARSVMEHFNLEVLNGSVTAILGPNGAGKTTLLNLALGWLHPQSGQILLANQPLQDYTRRDLGKWMGLVPQSEHIPFEFSLPEYILLGRAPHLPPLAMPAEADYQIALQALKQVGLGSLQNRSILSLSGGERQLVLVARALAQQPRLLLLDEPTSHLDLSNKGRLVHLLRDLAAQGVTILFTTHEPEVASVLATDLILMREGRVLETGTFDQVFTSDSLTRLYHLPIKVADVAGQRVVLWN